MPRPRARGPLFLFLVLTLGIEAVTAFLRFGLGLEAARDTASTIGVLTAGLRVHHGYFGALVALIAAVFWKKSRSPLRGYWPRDWRWSAAISSTISWSCG